VEFSPNTDDFMAAETDPTIRQRRQSDGAASQSVLVELQK
jgi:hypothetical protein